MTPEQFQAHQAAQAAEQEAEKAKRAAQQAERQRMIDARKNGRKFDPKEQPDFFKMNLQKRAQEAAEREAQERARIANIDPRQIWFSTLSYAEQQRVTKWEAANRGLLYPMPTNFQVQLKEA